nr:excalibur calcium-binding domain-containing protein [Paenibacillus algicola]
MLTAVFIVGISCIAVPKADAKGVVIYSNCTELNKVYKGGVAKKAGIQNKGGKTKYKPFVSAALYEANYKKDRDKDGIACEK